MNGAGVSKFGMSLETSRKQWEQFEIRPVGFGALPAVAEQLFTKPRPRPKIEPNFAAPSWLFLKEKPQNSYEPGGLVHSLVSGTPKILVNPPFWTWTWLNTFKTPLRTVSSKKSQRTIIVIVSLASLTGAQVLYFVSQGSPDVHKILVRKIQFTPRPAPQKSSQTEEQPQKEKNIVKIDTFRGGRNSMDKRFCGYCRDQNYSGSGKIFPGIHF